MVPAQAPRGRRAVRVGAGVGGGVHNGAGRPRAAFFLVGVILTHAAPRWRWHAGLGRPRTPCGRVHTACKPRSGVRASSCAAARRNPRARAPLARAVALALVGVRRVFFCFLSLPALTRPPSSHTHTHTHTHTHHLTGQAPGWQEDAGREGAGLHRGPAGERSKERRGGAFSSRRSFFSFVPFRPAPSRLPPPTLSLPSAPSPPPRPSTTTAHPPCPTRSSSC